MKIRKSLLSICLAVCLALSFCPAALAAEADGVGEAPDAVTRAEALTLLWEASGSPAPENEVSPFADLTEDWYRDAVLWAAEQGITYGVSGAAFAPDAPVTRTQMAAFLYRAQGEPGKTGAGPWYADAVKWAFDHILIFGSALPLGGAGDDLCRTSDVSDYLERYFTAPSPEANEDIIILYTSDVHCGIDQGFGYAGLYELRRALDDQGYTTLLVDDGDAIQGEAIGTLSKGEAVAELMNAMGYDAAIPGNHEFDYGMPRFLEIAENAAFPYISCNFNREGERLFAPYVLLEAAGRKIAFVGVTTPQTLASSTPSVFRNDEGELLYGFLQDTSGEGVYAAVQSAVDAARAEGAAYVYVLAHLGLDEVYAPWTCADVIGHTTGIDVLLDGHSHDSEQLVMKNKDGANVTRSACGTRLSGIGYSRITPGEGIVETGIWSWTNPVSAPDALGLRNEMGDMVRAAKDTLAERLGEVVAHSSVLLTINAPAEADGSGKPIRMVRRGETNLGDFCADAIRDASGADVAVVNGGGIRNNLEQGDVTYGDILNVFPFGNELTVLAVTGQQILDALEWGARSLPGENGGFLQVSGLRYEADVRVPSGCITGEDSSCAGMEGERRVKNVFVGDEPLDPQRFYTLAGMNYTIVEHGDGFTAFDGAEVLQDRAKLDSQLLIDYIVETLGGEIGDDYADPCGHGRITILG